MFVNQLASLDVGITGEPVQPDFDINNLYETLQELGSGQFSHVYKCRSKSTGELLAMKVINKSSMRTPQHHQSFKTEISILKACRHPNITALENVFETREHLYLIIELAEGGELFDQIVEHGPYSEQDASSIIRQIIKAVAYLHEKGIAHRDIKPENILLKNKSQPLHIKLADFGLAKILSSVQFTYTACGTPGYVAPEVLFRRGYDKVVDMWSVGVIMYILLSGYPPFHDKQAAMLYEKIKTANYAFHDKYWSGISQQAKDLIRKLLVVDPRARLSGEEALKHPWLSGLTTPALPLPNLFAQMRRFQAERRAAPPIDLFAPTPDSAPAPEQQEDAVMSDQ